MLWSGDEVSKLFEKIRPDQIQPSGVDLTLGKVFAIKGVGKIFRNSVELPDYLEIEPNGHGIWMLESGAYIIQYEQTIRIPKNAAGLVLPRSSLMRMGAHIFTALWDPGYVGKGVSLLYVFNPNGIEIEKGARIAQLILIDARSSTSYRGRYQFEGLR